MSRSHASSTSVTCAASAATAATPTCTLRCRSASPTSAAATAYRRRSSATTGRTTDRFSFSEWTSPRRRSATSDPVNNRVLPPRLLAQLERLDHVTDLDVVERAQPDTALVALADLGRVLLEPLEGLHGEVVRDHGPVPDEPGLGVAPDLPGPHQAARHVADPRHPEDLADLRRAELRLLVLGLEHALERGLDLLDGLVDHGVIPDLHALAVGRLTGPPDRADVEADDDRVGGGGQVDVVLGDATDAAVDHPQRHVLADLDLHQRVLERLDRSGAVALEDQVELLDLALLEHPVQVVQRDAAPGAGQLRVALARLPPLGDLPGDPVLLDDEEVVAGAGHGGEAEHLHRPGWGRLGELAPVLVEHRPDPPEGVAGDDRVADVQRAPLDQHGRHRAAAAVEVRLDGDALRVLVGIGPQVERGVRGEQHGLQQVVDADPLPGGDVDEHRVAAVLLGHQPVLGELLTDLGRVGPLLVDLVDRDHDRHLGGLGVVERLDRLGHDAVVGGDDQDDDVGDLRASGTHRGERLVTRGVDEGDRALVVLQLGDDLVGADVLGDATGLARHDVRVPQRV